jgi:protein-S-isoprenylcysteine O-methyltransferase Ste14
MGLYHKLYRASLFSLPPILGEVDKQIFLAISSALILGSLWALVPAGAVVILLFIRTYLEDTTLQKELSGYADYTQKVRCRLLPGIW